MTYLFLQDAEKMVLEMLSKHTVKGKRTLAGNTVSVDQWEDSILICDWPITGEHGPAVHRQVHARAGGLAALQDSGRVHHQGADQEVVPTGLRGRAQEERRPLGSRRYRGQHCRAEILQRESVRIIVIIVESCQFMIYPIKKQKLDKDLSRLGRTRAFSTLKKKRKNVVFKMHFKPF